MAIFQYKALQPNGAVVEGELEASGRPDAFRQMETRGLRPVRLSELGGRAPEAAARVQELLDEVGLPDAADRKVGGYSRGMRQRLGLADALVKDPDVLMDILLGNLSSMLGVALDSDAESGCGLDKMYGDDVLTILEFEESDEDEKSDED